jgi:hypothetical protein
MAQEEKEDNDKRGDIKQFCLLLHTSPCHDSHHLVLNFHSSTQETFSLKEMVN